MKRKLFIIIAVVILAMLGYFILGDKNPEVEHVSNESKQSYDYSKQSQIYFEYIGTYLTDRSTGLFSDHDDAQEFIINELKHAGYKDNQISLQDIEGRKGQNIVLKVDGKDKSKSIIVGAHYDGDGAGDNGSGTALLLATACGLVDTKPAVNTYYVFFDEEEVGGLGSEAFADRISKKEAKDIVYMINIDAIAFGDYCNIYGGNQNSKTKRITQTEGYEYACSIARNLGFNVYGPNELSGYFQKHGKGPDLDKKGVFTNPWTIENPAPENTVEDSLHAYSPSTIPASDHVPFMKKGIPYIYFEATNWFVKTDYEDMEYIGYTDVADENVGDGGLIMNTKYDTLETMHEHYPGRSLEHFELYSPILSRLILYPNI